MVCDKVTVWDSGKGSADGKTSTAGFLSGLAGAIPPIHELARNAGVELPAFLGKTSETQLPASTSEDQPEAQI